ncbi:hypothetical protein ACJ73_02373 [Blastomyces percursus]|uniref:Uncharacterized protein n=1 Tax=Blastomyces percursus TaxID=1658174 RepID=A0A1J9QBN2_9EURO|nr:hypothetical protein ACJ73_02373 [Blastomyces percursus]
MDAIREFPAKGDVVAVAANCTRAPNTTTTKTTLPVTTTLSETNKRNSQSYTFTSTSSNFLAILTALVTPFLTSLQTAIHSHLPESSKSRLSSFIDVYSTRLSNHPHITTFVTIQLLFAALPLLFFTLFATGTILFLLVLAFLGAITLSALAIGGALLVVIPVTVSGAVVAGMMCIGCWMGWYGVVWTALTFGRLVGSNISE